MRRRLTLAIVLTVLVTLVVSGFVSIAIAARSADDQTRHELVNEGQGLAAAIQDQADSAPSANPARALRTLLVALTTPLRLDGVTVVGVRADGQLFDLERPSQPPQLPSGLTDSDLQPTNLNSLQVVSGKRGRVVFAAVPYKASIQILGAARQVVQTVVLTRTPPSAWATAGPWLGLSALIILVGAGIVAERLGRRFVRPIRAAQAVTARIAAGDLQARVRAPAGSADPELADLAASVNSMAESLARARASERHFLQSVSHDLRTPLTSIRGFAEAIEDGATADSVAAARVIAAESRRLERLVGDLLALATVEARRFTLRMGPLDLAVSAAEAAAGFGPAAAEIGLGLVVDQPARPCPAVADPDRLAQVTANLIENALRYAATTIRLTTRPAPPGGMAEMWVTDDGPGISPANLGRVFERLFVARSQAGPPQTEQAGPPQTDQARPPGTEQMDRPIGSGLGLTIVAELVQAMGGTVRAESPAGPFGGTRMVVALPAAAVPVDQVVAPV